MLTIDTSGLYSLIDRRETNHRSAKEVLVAAGGPYVVPAAILAEITYLIEQRMPGAIDPFLTDIENGSYTLDSGAGDMPRIRELVKKYADLPLGFADAAVIACAERGGGSVLTFDRRDFGVVAREGRIRLLPSVAR